MTYQVSIKVARESALKAMKTLKDGWGAENEVSAAPVHAAIAQTYALIAIAEAIENLTPKQPDDSVPWVHPVDRLLREADAS